VKVNKKIWKYEMKIKILGSGTILSSKKRNPAGYILENNDKFLLLDAGSGIMKQLDVIALNVLKIETVFISHFHVDHCSDLIPILLRRYLLDSSSNKYLHIYGPKGLKVWFSGQAVFQGKWLSEHLPVLIELDNSTIALPELKIRTILNGHTENSISFYFEGEKSFFYSSDVGFNRDLIPFAKGVNTALIECSLPDEEEVEGHLTPTATAELAKAIDCERLLVTHIYPENDTENLKGKIAKIFKNEIVVVYDFLEIEL
jgi:ribonuclease BN (tRNA processing enzyme)